MLFSDCMPVLSLYSFTFWQIFDCHFQSFSLDVVRNERLFFKKKNGALPSTTWLRLLPAISTGSTSASIALYVTSRVIHQANGANCIEGGINFIILMRGMPWLLSWCCSRRQGGLCAGRSKSPISMRMPNGHVRTVLTGIRIALPSLWLVVTSFTISELLD